MLKWLMKFIGGRLDGYKTIIGGVGLILTGVGAIITAITMAVRIMFPDQTQFPEATTEVMLATFGTGTALISSGIAKIGIGQKTEKQTAAINTQTVAIKTQTEAIVYSVDTNTVAVKNQPVPCDDSAMRATYSNNPSGMSPENER